MILWLSRAQVEAILAHALRDSPYEACGLLCGAEQNGILRGTTIVPVPNIAPDPAHHFYMDEAALVRVMLDLSARGLILVGIYHSHPQGDPIPSPEDVRSFHYPGTAALIVGLKNAQPDAGSVQAWDIRAGSVTPATLHIGDDPPPVEQNLSLAGKTAVLISALIAVAFMILLSVALLPPAPDLGR